MATTMDSLMRRLGINQHQGPEQTKNIFCTPENRQHYEKLPYKALNEGRKEIRLLKFLANNDDGANNIACELLQNIPLEKARYRFVALSYCAGSAQDTRTIFVNGQECNVFANLHHALTKWREYTDSHPTQDDLLVWADQICIHQPDLAERSSQVGLMGEIYRAARETMICLSTPSSLDGGFAWARELLMSSLMEYHRHWFAEESLHNLAKEVKMLDNGFCTGWRRFLDILRSHWWTRAWVFQEFLLSRRPIFLHGSSSIECDDLDLLLEKACGIMRCLASVGSQEITTLCRDTLDARSQVDRYLTRKDEFGILELERPFPDTIKLYKTVDHFRPTTDLKTLLFNANYFSASDERDKIYAFLGLTNAAHGIIADYSTKKSIERLFSEVTYTVIKLERSIEVLKYAWCSSNRAEHTQSWVVEWTRLDCSKVEGLVFIPDKLLPIDWHSEVSFTSSSPPAVVVYGVKLPTGDLTYKAVDKGTENDETWVLYGLKCPVFLRPKSRLRYTYTLVAPTRFRSSSYEGHRVDRMKDIFEKVASRSMQKRRIEIC